MSGEVSSASDPRPARTVAAHRAGPGTLLRNASPRWYLCMGILLVAAAGMQSLAAYCQWYFRKEPVPLKRPLAQLDWFKLAPRYRPHAIQPPLMKEEERQQLGTEDYVQERLVDTQRAATDPTAVANVFITYYTGQPDMVPHVPDECYLAGGFDPVKAPDTVRVPVAGVGAEGDEIPVRVLQFQSRDAGQRPTTVLYFFHVNGKYRTTRNEVRTQLAGLRERHAYYAKIEITLTNDSPSLQRVSSADEEQSRAALAPLLARLMPVLLKDHFAWDEVRATGAQAK